MIRLYPFESVSPRHRDRPGDTTTIHDGHFLISHDGENTQSSKESESNHSYIVSLNNEAFVYRTGANLHVGIFPIIHNPRLITKGSPFGLPSSLVRDVRSLL